MTNDPPIAVLCVDDNVLVADAIALKLRTEAGLRWLGSLESTEGLLEAVLARRPGVLLLDIDMPGTDPFVVIERLAEVCSECRVIMFSGHVRPDLLERAIAAGAWGYVSKCDGESSMVEGIRRVARGEFAMSPEVCSVCERG